MLSCPITVISLLRCFAHTVSLNPMFLPNKNIKPGLWDGTTSLCWSALCNLMLLLLIIEAYSLQKRRELHLGGFWNVPQCEVDRSASPRNIACHRLKTGFTKSVGSTDYSRQMSWTESTDVVMMTDGRQRAEEVLCLLSTHRSPGLNSRENLVLFFLCFLFRLRMESGMLFFRLIPRPPLWDEAVELADDVSELQYRRGLLKHILMVETVQMDIKLLIFLSFRKITNIFLESMTLKSLLLSDQISKMERGI